MGTSCCGGLSTISPPCTTPWLRSFTAPSEVRRRPAFWSRTSIATAPRAVERAALAQPISERDRRIATENDMAPPRDRRISAPNCVTIFGGGIAGLTAAHELVERNFKVVVWEPGIDSRYPDAGCDVGGMARTQWAAVP